MPPCGTTAWRCALQMRRRRHVLDAGRPQHRQGQRLAGPARIAAMALIDGIARQHGFVTEHASQIFDDCHTSLANREIILVW